MGLLRCLQTALSNLRTNKLRSALTMLGVIIGVSAVIVMVSIVEGARAQIVAEFQRLGSQLILVAYQPDREERQHSTRLMEFRMFCWLSTRKPGASAWRRMRHCHTWSMAGSSIAPSRGCAQRRATISLPATRF